LNIGDIYDHVVLTLILIVAFWLLLKSKGWDGPHLHNALMQLWKEHDHFKIETRKRFEEVHSAILTAEEVKRELKPQITHLQDRVLEVERVIQPLKEKECQ
jgi:uncharacterized coiled-coil DUF342 family protein